MKADESKKSYVFPVVVEPDGKSWRAYQPEIEARGAATWGHTREEALKNIQEVIQMVVVEMIEDRAELPKAASAHDEVVVAVNV